jgi:hypothetical protein
VRGIFQLFFRETWEDHSKFFSQHHFVFTPRLVPSAFSSTPAHRISLSQGKTLTTLLQAHVDVIVAGMQRAAGAK